MSQVNNRGVVNKRLRISSTGGFRPGESQSSPSSTNASQSQHKQPGFAVDDETELSSDAIKEQLNHVEDILTQPIIEVPTKRLLHIKELGGNLFVSSSRKIYSKTLQKLIDRVLFTKSLNNDVSTASSDLHVFERVLARTDDNDAYSTCTSLAQPIPATILVLGMTACEHALVWKLSQRRHYKIYCSPANSGITIDQSLAIVANILHSEKDILNFVDLKQIDLVISLNISFYYENLEAQLSERGVHYLGCSTDTLALVDDQLGAKQFMSKYKIPTLDWNQCSNQEDAEAFLNKCPNQQQWIIRSVNGHENIHCQTRDEALETLKNVFQNKLFGENAESVIVEHGYSTEDTRICTLYIVSDGDGDYTQLPIIESDSLRLGAYGPCPYLTPKQLSYIRRRIVERTLRCSPSIRHLFGFRLLLQGTNFNDVILLGYKATLDEPEGEVIWSLCEPDLILQYALDLPSIPILPLTNKKRRSYCVNTVVTVKSPALTISNKVLFSAAKNYKVQLFHNETNVTTGNMEIGNITTNGERIFNVLGYGSTLQEAQIQSVLACQYIKQQTNIDDLSFKTDIGIQAIEWCKIHGNHPQTTTGALTNGRKKLTKKKKSISSTDIHNELKQTSVGNCVEDDDDESEDEEEIEPMDFERAFGSTSDIPKSEYYMNSNQNKNRTHERSSTFEGELYFDFANKIDLNTFKQPVLVSSTINLNPLASLFNLNDRDLVDSQNIFEYLGYELAVRCVNDLCIARTLYIQCCSLPISSYKRSIQRFYQGIEQACQQLNCTFLKTTSISSSFTALCTGVCNRDLCLFDNENSGPMINEGDLLVGLRCSSSTVNSQGYVRLKELFQKKNVHLNDSVPFRNNDGEEETFFSLLLQKSSILTPSITAILSELISNQTIKFIRYLKDVGLSRMIQSLIDSSTGSMIAELNGQKWPTMPPIFTWIYQNSGYSQDEMFEYFNCGIDYLLVIDPTKSSIENMMSQLTQSYTTCFLLGTFTSTNSTSARNKSVHVPQQNSQRSIQLKNISFKYPRSGQTSNETPSVVKDRMKQPIANDKTRCAMLISTNDTSLLSLLAYSSSTLDCAFEIVLVLSTLASLSDIARINESYPSVVTKVIQPKKYAARNYDLDQKIDDELQLHGCELVILDRYACRLSPSFIQAWRGRLVNVYPSLLPSFRHSTSPIRDALQSGVRITGVTVHFIDESDRDNDGPIIAQESLQISPSENETQLENRLRVLEQQLYPKAIDMVASGQVIYQEKKRTGKVNIAPIIASSAY